jgi:hypothetical protein
VADSRRLAPDRLPTLTEVVDLEPVLPVRGRRPAAPVAPAPAVPVTAAPVQEPEVVADDDWASTLSPPTEPPHMPLPIAAAAGALKGDAGGDAGGGATRAAEPSIGRTIPASELTAEVLFELESRLDVLFEAQLREALAPALARVADGLIREAREQLSQRLREMVQDAVAKALERHTHL